MDVLAVKRSNESLVQLGEDGVGKLISTVLNFLELLHPKVDILEALEDLNHQARALGDVRRHLGKHLVELHLARDEADHLRGAPLAGRRIPALAGLGGHNAIRKKRITISRVAEERQTGEEGKFQCSYSLHGVARMTIPGE